MGSSVHTDAKVMHTCGSLDHLVVKQNNYYLEGEHHEEIALIAEHDMVIWKSPSGWIIL